MANRFMMILIPVPLFAAMIAISYPVGLLWELRRMVGTAFTENHRKAKELAEFLLYKWIPFNWKARRWFELWDGKQPTKGMSAF